MKKKKTSDDRINELVEAMTSETEDAPNEDAKTQKLAKGFGLGDSGDINQDIQDKNEIDDDDPMGGEVADNSNPMKAPLGKDVLTGQNRKLFRTGGRDVMSIIIRSHR